jgi:aryl-alcohol dehydrogenase-like predicted oxidoreductase
MSRSFAFPDHYTTHQIPDSVEIGTGAWAWGDRFVWGFGKDYGEDDARQAFRASLYNRVTFFDTAEMYGFGTSERLLGKFLKETPQPVMIATKFAPLPYRITKGRLTNALKGSLKRLGVASVDLYQLHFHLPPMTEEHWIDALADALDRRLARAAGVSNYDRGQTIRAHALLGRRGYPLASNQLEYSLIERGIERDGTKAACDERGIKIIAYSPLGMGLLTGKYTVENPPPGTRGGKYRKLVPKLPPLIALLRETGERHGGKSPAQVAINWTICKGTLPIPGAKNARQAEHNAGAVGWRLTPDDVAALDEMSDKVLSTEY